MSQAAAHTPSSTDSDTPGTTSPADQVVRNAIQEISHIATLPEVTMKIIRLVEDPDSTAHDLNRVITNDPALGARILKVVNSAFYGLPGQIGSINRAIVLLGLNAVKNIAIAASLAKLFRGGKIAPGFHARDLWNHAIATGTATRLLAKDVGLRLPDEAFLAGLIHNIGILVEIQALRPKFAQVINLLDQNPDMTLREAETRILGANHEQFGAGLCQMWKFPASFAYVTGFHHHPQDLAAKNRTLTALVHISDIVVARMELGFTRGTEAREIDPNLLEELKLSAAKVDEMGEELPKAMEEARQLFADVQP